MTVIGLIWFFYILFNAWNEGMYRAVVHNQYYVWGQIDQQTYMTVPRAYFGSVIYVAFWNFIFYIANLFSNVSDSTEFIRERNISLTEWYYQKYWSVNSFAEHKLTYTNLRARISSKYNFFSSWTGSIYVYIDRYYLAFFLKDFLKSELWKTNMIDLEKEINIL